MINKKRRVTIEELAEMEQCPCPICSGQDSEETILEREKLKELDEVCDVFSNEIIDLITESPSKYLLQDKNKDNSVE